MKRKLSKSQLFWTLQSAGWLLILTVYLLLYRRENLGNIEILIEEFYTQFTGFLVSLGLRYFYKAIKLLDKDFSKVAVYSILTSITAAILWMFSDIALSLTLRPWEYFAARMSLRAFASTTWSNSFVMLFWSGLYFGINYWFNFREQKELSEKANALAQSAQLQMLRYQLNPHFLFNSLNSIRAMIEEDKIRAKSMITELAEFLRYSLISKNFADVPLKEELDAMRHYLAIEKTRYEEKLDIKFEIDNDAEDFPVLSFLLHPLIENAIKYGMQTSEIPLKISISAKVENGRLKLQVCNSGKWIERKPGEISTGTGIGLKNVKQRLENAFGNEFKFEVKRSQELVCIEVEIRKRI